MARWSLDVAGLLAQGASLGLFLWRTERVHGEVALTAAAAACLVLVSLGWWPNFVKGVPGLYALKTQIRRHKVCVCLCVCLSVCLSIQSRMAKLLDRI